MGNHVLSKSTYIRGLQCQKSLYLNKHRPFLRDKLSAEQLARFRRGTNVGVLARDLFPGGIDMSPKSPSQYQKRVIDTLNALQDPFVNVIYEAVFQYDDVLIMLDVLVRNNARWEAYEVKSSLALSPTYYADAALQYYVIAGAGIELADFSIIYVNRDYVFQDKLELEKLFISQSVLSLVKEKLAETQKQIEVSKQTLLLKNSPDVSIGTHCNVPYPCDFQGHCWKKVDANSILSLTAFDEKDLFNWFHNSIQPESIKTSINDPVKLNQLDALVLNVPFYDKEALIATMKNQLEAKLLFIDILFVKPAIPDINGCRPYQALPLTMSTVFENNEKSVLFFEPTLSGVQLFIDKLDRLTDNDQLLMLFDRHDLLNFLNSWQTCLEADYTEKIFRITNNTFDLLSILESVHFFFPGVGRKPDLITIFNYCIDATAILPDKHWIAGQIADKTDPEEKARFSNQLISFADRLKELFFYFSKG
jgi:hypothetical protein